MATVSIKPAGSLWLKEYFSLYVYSLTHSSYIGNNISIKLTSKGNVEQVYRINYAPAFDTPLLHLAFSLKYDNLNLDFLKAIFKNIE